MYWSWSRPCVHSSTTCGTIHLISKKEEVAAAFERADESVLSSIVAEEAVSAAAVATEAESAAAEKNSEESPAAKN